MKTSLLINPRANEVIDIAKRDAVSVVAASKSVELLWDELLAYVDDNPIVGHISYSRTHETKPFLTLVNHLEIELGVSVTSCTFGQLQPNVALAFARRNRAVMILVPITEMGYTLRWHTDDTTDEPGRIEVSGSPTNGCIIFSGFPGYERYRPLFAALVGDAPGPVPVLQLLATIDEPLEKRQCDSTSAFASGTCLSGVPPKKRIHVI